MKRTIIIAAVLVVLLGIVLCVPSKKNNADYFRIHIRADSNATDDQNVKYAVKAAVVDYLTPHLAYATSKNKAMEIVRAHLTDIKRVCDAVLAQNGKTYQSAVKIAAEEFPDRAYNGYTLKAGVYDALIVELGSGSGNNWWCVVYPPLCFVGGEGNGTTNIAYKSKLLEIIEKWKNK